MPRTLIFALLLTLAAPAFAQAPPEQDPRTLPLADPKLRVHVDVGFEGRRDPTLPTPICLRVRNDGADFAGVWEVVLFEEGIKTPRRVERWPLEIAAGQTRVERRLLSIDEELRVCSRLIEDGKVRHQQANATDASLEPEALNLLVVLPPQHKQRLVVTRRKVEQDIASHTTPPYAVGTRQVDSRHVEVWGLPTEAAPLAAFNALVLVPGSPPRLPDAQQARAIGRYLWTGGALVLVGDDGVGPFIEALGAGLPADLAAVLERAPYDEDGITRTPLAAGSVLRVGYDVMGNRLLADKLAQALERRHEPGFPGALRRIGSGEGVSPTAMRSLLQVGGLFLTYALLTCPLTLLLFRKASRRVLAWFVTAVVVLFCVLSAALGPTLDLRPGEVDAMTVTELTPDGAVHWSLVTVSSGGARRHQLALSGDDLASWPMSSRRRDYYYGYYGGPSTPYVRTGNNVVADAAVDGYPDLRVAPWGRRDLLVSSREAKLPPLQISWTSIGANQVELSITNTLPVTLKTVDIRLQGWGRSANLGTNYVTVYQQRERIGVKLEPGKTIKHRLTVTLQEHYYDIDGPSHAGRSMMTPPSNQRKHLVGWLIAERDGAPPPRWSGPNLINGVDRQVFRQRLSFDDSFPTLDKVIPSREEDSDSEPGTLDD